MKKFSIVLGIVVITMFLSGVVYAEEPWVPMNEKLDAIYEIVLDTNDKITPVPCEGTPVAKTGQIISYEPGDDGALQMGVAPPVPRFTDNLDGTVTDNLTGLEWTKDARMYDITNWYQSMLNANNCNVGNYDDWRLPNIKEFFSLIDCGRYEPALSDNHPFINLKASYQSMYWASTTNASLNYNAYVISFGFGYISLGDKNNGSAYTWLVRGGE